MKSFAEQRQEIVAPLLLNVPLTPGQIQRLYKAAEDEGQREIHAEAKTMLVYPEWETKTLKALGKLAHKVQQAYLSGDDVEDILRRAERGILKE